MWSSTRIRAAFPGLNGEWAFLDNAGGTFPTAGVVERVRAHLAHHPVQLGASYPRSREAAERVAAGRAAAARLVHARPKECILGHSSTQNTMLVAEALGSAFGPGDAVVVTDADHAANQTPWRRLARRGVEVRTWPFSRDSLRLEPDELAPLLADGKVRLVACTHTSNITGTLTDVVRVAALAREHGALSFVDGVAFAPHRRVDVGALGVDFYALSFYKVFGPHLGLLFGRRELLRALENPNHAFVQDDELPRKLEPGNPPYELVAGVPGILEHLDELARHSETPAGVDPLAAAFDAIARYEEELITPLVTYLRDAPRVRIVGEPVPDRARRIALVSFVVEGVSSRTIVERLESYRLAARFGHFYSYDLVQRLGLLEQDGVVRISCAHTNTHAEIERVLHALEEILADAVPQRRVQT